VARHGIEPPTPPFQGRYANAATCLESAQSNAFRMVRELGLRDCFGCCGLFWANECTLFVDRRASEKLGLGGKLTFQPVTHGGRGGHSYRSTRSGHSRAPLSSRTAISGYISGSPNYDFGKIVFRRTIHCNRHTIGRVRGITPIRLRSSRIAAGGNGSPWVGAHCGWWHRWPVLRL